MISSVLREYVNAAENLENDNNILYVSEGALTPPDISKSPAPTSHRLRGGGLIIFVQTTTLLP